jgi:hypothetical protein
VDFSISFLTRSVSSLKFIFSIFMVNKSTIIQYFFKEVSVWQVSHPASGIETFYFPNGRVESHVPDPTRKEQEENGTHTLSIEKETLLPGGAGVLRSIDGGESRQVPVKIASLRKETLLPRPVPLMSR